MILIGLIILVGIAFALGRVSGKYWILPASLLSLPLVLGVYYIVYNTNNPYTCPKNSFCFGSETGIMFGWLFVVVGLVLLLVGVPLIRLAAKKHTRNTQIDNNAISNPDVNTSTSFHYPEDDEDIVDNSKQEFSVDIDENKKH